MKLFKSLLVAPATLGLLAPLSATANNINLVDVNTYSSSEEVKSISEFNSADLAVTNSRVDGLEARLNEYEAGSFSETTTASFSADFAIGVEDEDGYAASVDAMKAVYGFQIDLNTSFTGEDSLDISLDAGNGGEGLSQLDLNDFGTNDALGVDGVSYTFPVGSITMFAGVDVDGSSLYNTACVYGGPSDTLDDCGNASSALGSATTAAGASFELGNGFDLALGYTGDGTGSGLLTSEGLDSYGGQLTYTADSFGASVTYALIEGASATDTTYYALNGYWTPDETGSVPSISVGYETADPENTDTDSTQWFVGLQWDEIGPGTLGAAVGTTGSIADNADETLMYEAFYSYSVNDGMTITPLVYIKEVSTIGVEDETGVMVKTSFSF